jgi:hypothetical protein
MLALALLATLLSLAEPANAGATSEIEGVWSFNGGEVAIHPVAGGQLEGVVVAPTTFAECTHTAGEHMWTGITSQADGSFWGSHRWLFEKSCLLNPTPGPTAWRVLHNAAGQRELKVCFSEPGSGQQPTIAPSGATTNATYGCRISSPTALLPVVVGTGASTHGARGEAGAEQISFATTVLLPKANLCVRRGGLRIKIADPKRDPLKEVVIRIGRRTVAVVRGVKRLQRAIVLKGLPNGSYTIKIVATTVLDQKLRGRRAYHSCKRGRHHRTKRHPRAHGRRH